MPDNLMLVYPNSNKEAKSRQKDANGIANSVDPDLIWVCTVFPDLFFQKTEDHYGKHVKVPITAKLICVFVFAYVKSWFSHDEAHMVAEHRFDFTIRVSFRIQIRPDDWSGLIWQSLSADDTVRQRANTVLGDFFFISWFTDPPTQIFAF